VAPDLLDTDTRGLLDSEDRSCAADADVRLPTLGSPTLGRGKFANVSY
jgi:hypothetical protein